MNVSEAINTQTLLRWLLGLEDRAGRPMPTEREARRAAVMLAKRAHQALAGGITPEAVEEAWSADGVGARLEKVL